MRPGHEPITTLARALLASGVLGKRTANEDEATELIAAVLGRGPLGVAELLREAELPEEILSRVVF